MYLSNDAMVFPYVGEGGDGSEGVGRPGVMDGGRRRELGRKVRSAREEFG